MNAKKDSSPSDPQDGFDYLEYPVEFNFKALCRAEEGAPAIAYIAGIITPMVDDGALLDLTSKTSRTGRFESVTAVVRIKSRDELESIYKLIAQSSRVVMTL